MSTVNMVRYFFYRENFPRTQKRLQTLVGLAYQTARDRKLYSKAVLIRYANQGLNPVAHAMILMIRWRLSSEAHDTTSIGGKYQKDPLGRHVTLCYKDQAQLAQGTHVASHGYVKEKDDTELMQATHDPAKADSVLRGNGKPVWPSEDQLKEAPEIGYGHFTEDDKE